MVLLQATIDQLLAGKKNSIWPMPMGISCLRN